ncbi:PilN domain-containing protein [Photobacterium rosenbergii]|uniref:PilN domain-containing protein n=1 Tax=Photobacterium rosenbergii TaxID=294936 RepID=UPI001C98E4F1|nr:PilN domain-containing protein [Photobacterium rosenbergii]MBY5947379.1 PilN domain-containing protein [Photobacterium rosenbergii]
MKKLRKTKMVNQYCLLADEKGRVTDLQGSELETQAIKPQLLDKVIWLVTPQRCLFKQLEYDTEYVSASEIEECVRSDIEQWTIWADTAMFHLSQKVGQHWKVAVWIWDERKENELLNGFKPTHIIPHSAYVASSIDADELMITQVFGQEWLIVKDAGNLVHGVHSADSQLAQHQLERRYERQIERKDHLFKFQYEGSWLPDAKPLEFAPKAQIVHQGKQKGVVDFTEVQTYIKPIAALGLALVIWMLGDYFILNANLNEAQDKTVSLSSQSMDAMTKRNEFKFIATKLTTLNSYLDRQQQPMEVLANLTDLLPHDVYLNAMEVNNNTINLTGQGSNVARLPALLEQWELVESAMFTSDIRQVGDSGETFRLQLVLKGVTH